MFKKDSLQKLRSNLNIQLIYQFGDQFALDKYCNEIDIKKELEVFENQWTQYNPRKKHIKRYGLSVLNHNGKIGYGPDLDSIYEYNKIHKTHWTDNDFNKPTPVWTKSKILPCLFKGIFPYCVRVHFLKLLPGGFFPPHRDHNAGKQESFRMLVPIKNFNPPYFYFMLEQKPLYWNYGQLYVVNTTKHHALFNLNVNEESLFLVITVKLCQESIDYVSSHLKEK